MFMAIGVRGVFCAAQTGFDQRETGLHEHDEEARDECPDKVDRVQVVRDAIV